MQLDQVTLHCLDEQFQGPQPVVRGHVQQPRRNRPARPNTRRWQANHRVADPRCVVEAPADIPVDCLERQNRIDRDAAATRQGVLAFVRENPGLQFGQR